MSIARTLLLRASQSAWLANQASRRAVTRRAVRRFMPGETSDEALNAARDLSQQGIGTILTQLGENVTELTQAAAVRDHYMEVYDQLDELPTEVSVKLTQLGLDIDPGACEGFVWELVERAERADSLFWIDMEDSRYVDVTLDLYRRLRAKHPKVGVAIQAYLHRTPADIASLLPLAPTIRLVKGAYNEPASVALPSKRDVDEQFYTLGSQLLDTTASGTVVVFGTHDLPLVARLRKAAADRHVAAGAYQVHMLYGIRSDALRQLATEGIPVKMLISYGSAWFAWYMRRLAERPANVWFVAKSLFT